MEAGLCPDPLKSSYRFPDAAGSGASEKEKRKEEELRGRRERDIRRKKSKDERWRKKVEEVERDRKEGRIDKGRERRREGERMDTSNFRDVDAPLVETVPCITISQSASALRSRHRGAVAHAAPQFTDPDQWLPNSPNLKPVD